MGFREYRLKIDLGNLKSNMRRAASFRLIGYEVPFLAAIDRSTHPDLGSSDSCRAGFRCQIRHIVVGSNRGDHRSLHLVACHA